MDKVKKKQETSAKVIVEIIKNHILLIFVSGLIGVTLTGIVTFLIIQPRYSAETQLIVTLPATEENNAGNVDTNLRLLKTYKDFVKGNLVLKHVSERMDKDHNVKISPEKLKNSIQVEQADDSQMFSIKTESTSPQTAADIANVTAKSFQNDVKKVLKADQIVIVSEADANLEPVSPNKSLNLLIGLLLGLVTGLGIASMLSFFDRTLTSEQFIVEQMESPILGNIPKLSSKELKESILQNSSLRNSGNSMGTATSRRARR